MYAGSREIAASCDSALDMGHDRVGALDMKSANKGNAPNMMPPSPPDSNYSSPAEDPAQSFLEQAYAQGRIPTSKKATITYFLELWDYVGGCSFRGFIAENPPPTSTPSSPTDPSDNEKSLFLFLKPNQDLELKHGLLALIELATECFQCENLVLAIDREAEGVKDLMKDLGWVGFELVTLDKWRGEKVKGLGEARVSERWIFAGMEL